MSNATLENLIEEYEDAGREDVVAELIQLRGSELRKQAARLPEIEKRLSDAQAEHERLSRGPAVREAFQAAGVDFGALSKVERRAIESYDGELDEDSVGDWIEENEVSVR
jgi:hypothetical protein